MIGAQLFARAIDAPRNDTIHHPPLMSGYLDVKTILRNPREFDDPNATKNGCVSFHTRPLQFRFVHSSARLPRHRAVSLDRHVTNSDRKSVVGAK